MTYKKRTITNGDVLYSRDLVNTGRFMIHGTIETTERNATIRVKESECCAAFSANDSKINTHAIESFFDGSQDSYLLAVGIGLEIDGKLLLGRRPPEISIAPNCYTVAGGRCSENPNETIFKELAEEIVLVAERKGANRTEIAFVEFNPSKEIESRLSNNEIRNIQTHAIESLPYQTQALASGWIDGIVTPISFDGELTTRFTHESNEHFSILSHSHPCVIDEYKTIDILIPCKLTLPDGWKVVDAYFLENPNYEVALKTPVEWKKMLDVGQFTSWAKKFIDLYN